MMATERTMLAEVELEEEEYSCPIATRDLAENLKARNFAFQHYGYGSAMLREVIKHCPTLSLTSVTDPAVRAWYVKHGFQQIGDDIFRKHTHNLRKLDCKKHCV